MKAKMMIYSIIWSFCCGIESNSFSISPKLCQTWKKQTQCVWLTTSGGHFGTILCNQSRCFFPFNVSGERTCGQCYFRYSWSCRATTLCVGKFFTIYRWNCWPPVTSGSDFLSVLGLTSEEFAMRFQCLLFRSLQPRQQQQQPTVRPRERKNIYETRADETDRHGQETSTFTSFHVCFRSKWRERHFLFRLRSCVSRFLNLTPLD